MVVEAAQDQQGVLGGGGQSSRRQMMPADGTGPKKHGKSPQSRGVLTQARASVGASGGAGVLAHAARCCAGMQRGRRRRKKVEKLRKGKWKRSEG